MTPIAVANAEGLTDERLIARADADAVAELYRRHGDRAEALVRAITRNRDDAQELRQDVFVSLLEALQGRNGEIEPIVRPREWLRRAARNAALNHIKRRARVSPLDPAEIVALAQANRDGNDPELDTVEVKLLLGAASLTPKQFEVLFRTVFAGLTSKEIAELVGCTPEAVRQTLVRAGKAVDRELRNAGYEPRPTRRRRSSMLIRIRGLPVLGARRFALRAQAPGRC